MDSQSFRIQTLLQRFLRDECNEAEMRELLQYLNSREGIREAEQEMDARFMMPGGISITPEVSERILDRLRNNVGLTEKSKEATGVPNNSRKYLLRFAASVAGLLLMAGIAYFILNKEQMQLYTTEAIQKRTVILPDGSLVTLNGGSSISFKAGDARREVLLDGEAYFDVKHDPEKPFYVNTSQIEIKVLGTAFNVKSYAGDDAVETTLIRGKVTVRNLSGPEKNEEIELIPNQQAVFDKTTLLLNKAGVEKETGTAWHKGNLVFEDEPIQNILEELGKWYGVNIQVASESKDCRFNIFIENETLDEVLQLFDGINNARVIQNGKRIKIEGKLCQ